MIKRLKKLKIVWHAVPLWRVSSRLQLSAAVGTADPSNTSRNNGLADGGRTRKKRGFRGISRDTALDFIAKFARLGEASWPHSTRLRYRPNMGDMALTNAEKQARWRAKRNALEQGRPDVIEAALLEEGRALRGAVGRGACRAGGQARRDREAVSLARA